MIKKVILKNFESHEDSEIEFTDGLNLLIGQSNQGKSSIVRAISLVVANQFDKEQVRTGKDFCEITVITDKGHVTARRGESVNQWETCKDGESPKYYKSIGTGVPPEAMGILGMGEVIHGDVNELPNIMFQHEKHYMLSEINGKKATSNMIARMMDDAIGIGGMEELIKSMADDLAAEKKSFNQINNEISGTKTQLIDDIIFSDYEKIISRAEKLLLEHEEDTRLLQNSSDISRRFKELIQREDSLDEHVKISNDILSKWDLLKTNHDKLNLLNEAISMQNKLDKLNNLHGLSSSIIQKGLKLQQSFLKLKDFDRLMELKSKMNSTSIESMELILKRFKGLSELTEKASKMNKNLSDARKMYLDIQKAKKELGSMEDRMKSSQSKLDELKNNLGVCPLCGAKL